MKTLVTGCLAVILVTSSFSVKAETSDVFDALAKNSATKIFADAIVKSGLKDELSTKSAISIFALTDDGFNKVAEKDTLLGNKEKLAEFLKAYIVDQKIDLAQIETEMEYVSLSGSRIKVGAEKKVNGLSVLNEEHMDQASIYTVDSPWPASTDLSSWSPLSHDWHSTLFNIPWLNQWMPPLKLNMSTRPLVVPSPKASSNVSTIE